MKLFFENKLQSQLPVVFILTVPASTCSCGTKYKYFCASFCIVQFDFDCRHGQINKTVSTTWGSIPIVGHRNVSAQIKRPSFMEVPLLFDINDNLFNGIGCFFIARFRVGDWAWWYILSNFYSNRFNLPCHHLLSWCQEKWSTDQKVWTILWPKWVRFNTFTLSFYKEMVLILCMLVTFPSISRIELNEPTTSATFMELHGKIKQLCRMTIFSLVKVTATMFIVPTFLATISNYFMLNLGEDSFLLPSPISYVL